MAGRLLPIVVALAMSTVGAVQQQPLNPAAPRLGESIAGKLLVADPELRDPNFDKTVVFMVKHDESGAMGVIINRKLGSLGLASLLEELGKETEGVTGDISVHFGGPVDRVRSFVLHSNDYHAEGSISLEHYALTPADAVVDDIAHGRGPRRALLALGYAGWGGGQLEAEFERGGWVIAPADPDILFDLDYDTKWKRAFASRFLST